MNHVCLWVRVWYAKQIKILIRLKTYYLDSRMLAGECVQPKI